MVGMVYINQHVLPYMVGMVIIVEKSTTEQFTKFHTKVNGKECRAYNNDHVVIR